MVAEEERDTLQSLTQPLLKAVRDIRDYLAGPVAPDAEIRGWPLVIPVHPFGWVVWAYKTCRCIDCNKVRVQTKLWEAREAKIKRLNEVYGCINPETCPWHKDQLGSSDDLHQGDI